MRTLLIDMPSGVAGDMLLAALLACGGDRVRLERDLAGLGLGPIGVAVQPVQAGGLAALRARVRADQEATWSQAPLIPLAGRAQPRPAPTAAAPLHPVHPGHPHRPWRDIRDLLARAPLPERVRDRAQRCFHLLAEAEAAVHGTTPDLVEFHEVGSVDAIADVVGCCLLLEQLGIDRVIAGSILPGHGTVRCAHGLMPVPVPAVAEILRATGAPCRTLDRETGELTTPTGACLVCGLANDWVGGGRWEVGGDQASRVVASGYGAGSKTVPGLTNVVRCLVLESLPPPTSHLPPDREAVLELRCQLDDITGEDLALLLDDLLEAGALDACIAPLVMKKGRPGHRIEVLCREADRARLADLLLTRSSTIGVRWSPCERQVLPRRGAEVAVGGQRIALKVVALPGGGERAKPESDSLAAAARALGWPVDRVRQAALAAWDASRSG